MPNPRNRHSRQRKRTRRGHDKALMPTLSVCKTTGETHMRHHAYKHDGNTYHRGLLLIKGKVAPAAAAEE